MMKIKLWVKRQEQIEKDVKFPIYRQHILSDNCMSYTRIDEDLTAFAINEETYQKTFLGTGYEHQIEFETKYNFDRSDIDYHLGLNANALTKDEFDAVFERFFSRIVAIKEKYLDK